MMGMLSGLHQLVSAILRCCTRREQPGKAIQRDQRVERILVCISANHFFSHGVRKCRSSQQLILGLLRGITPLRRQGRARRL